MLEPLIDRWAEKHLGPGRPVPRWMRGLLDETFLWVAAGELLIALHVPRESVRRLTVLQGILEEYRDLLREQGVEVRRLEDVRTLEDLDGLAEGEAMPSLPVGLPADATDGETLALLARQLPATTLARWIEDGAAVVLDLAEQTLEGLRRRRVRPELVGADPAAVQELIRELRRRLAALDLPALGRAGYPVMMPRLEEAAREIEQLDLMSGLEVAPRAPRPGEVQRIVGILQDLPAPTRERLIPVSVLRSRLVLAPLLARVLADLRAGWIDPAERPEPPSDEEAAAIRARAAADRRERTAREASRRELGRLAVRRTAMRLSAQGAAMLIVAATWVQVWVLGTQPDSLRELGIPRIGAAQATALLLALVVVGALAGPAQLGRDPLAMHESPTGRLRADVLRVVGGLGDLLLLVSCLGVWALLPTSPLRGSEWYRREHGDALLALEIGIDGAVGALDPGVVLIIGVIAAAVLGMILGHLGQRRLRRRAGLSP
ncbi:hypothetical protein [Brachybacterium sp. J153]|uniref:hypothetical protein n=1 Tax=Brachybacterium sp. J153 TaxID=3116488 RepID=UPI002E77A000|nr:hypothetical protein [Brachybacterium sp. J153]MEE1619022.1 hypothetical protein [Brachybacterium sp. J153]